MFNRELPEYKGLTKKERQILRIPDPRTGLDQSRPAQKERSALKEKVQKGEGGHPEWEG